MPHSLYFAVHNHQPVGNFDSVIDEAFEKAYLPFLRLVKRFPAFKFALHNSGILYEWAEKRKPEFFALIEELLGQKQLELLGGGFYEPILPSIPEADRAGQIKKMSDYLEKRFDQRPKGIWIAERVWEPDLPRTLAAAGIEYTMLDDTLFAYAGYDGPLTAGPVLTEDEGHPVYVFPILKELRYKIPFGTVEDVAHRLFAQTDNPKSWVYADDGEKFGIWPKTHEHCYTNGWLQRFLEAVTSRPELLQLKFFSEPVARGQAAGRTYLPTAAYEEMLEWALPAQKQLEFESVKEKLKQIGEWEKAAPYLRGGFWRSFLAKYPETNHLHKKILFVSQRLQKLKGKSKVSKAKFLEAQDLLYKGQCNCPLWHGVFGGAYLTHLRAANYEALIGAQNFIYDMQHKKPAIAAEEIDFDCDGQNEIAIETATLFCIVKPHSGGCITELDYKPKRFNLQNTFTSYPEAYHKKLAQAGQSSTEVATIHAHIEAKEDDLEKFLPIEGRPVRPNWSFYDCKDGELLFPAYASHIRNSRNQLTVELQAVEKDSLSILKNLQFDLKRSRVDFAYRLKNPTSEKLTFLWQTEFNFNFEAPYAPDRYFKINGQKPSRPTLEVDERVGDVTTVEMVDEWRKLAALFRFKQAVTLERRPIFTVSLSEGGAEKTFQGTKLLFGFPVELGFAQAVELNFSLELLSL